jgi:hypothetical protein
MEFEVTSRIYQPITELTMCFKKVEAQIVAAPRVLFVDTQTMETQRPEATVIHNKDLNHGSIKYQLLLSH